MKPADRRCVVQFWVDQGMRSERQGCRLIGVSRSTVRYRPHGSDDSELRTRLKALAEQYPRYGYPTLHDMLRLEGLVMNPKRTYRIYSEEGLQVRRKKRKKLIRPRVPVAVPVQQNERWSIDFVSDQLATGRRFRVFNTIPRSQVHAWCVSWIRWGDYRRRSYATRSRTDEQGDVFLGKKTRHQVAIHSTRQTDSEPLR